MRETIDQGLGELQTKQGKGGLPPGAGQRQGGPETVAAVHPREHLRRSRISQPKSPSSSRKADRAEAEANQTAPSASGPNDSAALPRLKRCRSG